jgi:iron(III) transport system permease protein
MPHARKLPAVVRGDDAEAARCVADYPLGGAEVARGGRHVAAVQLQRVDDELALVGLHERLNSFLLAAVAALVTLLVALLLAYGKRLRPTRAVRTAVAVASLGYAVPGLVIAIGVIVPFAWFDNALDAAMREWFGVSTGLILSGTVAALLFAYAARFLAVAVHAVDAGLATVKPSMDEAARVLGRRPAGVLARVHLPILRGSLLTALLLVFVDVLKELPATLVLRPFNFNTLAVRAFELASDEFLAESSLAALAIVAVGVLPVILLSRVITRGS